MRVRRSTFQEVIERLGTADQYGLDTETYGLRFKDRLFSIIIAHATCSYYFNFHEYEGVDAEFILPREWMPHFNNIFGNTDSTFFISNAKFDLAMLRKEGLEVQGKVICTNQAGRVARNNYLQGYSLEKSAERIGLKKDDRAMKYIKQNRLYTKERIPGKKLEFKSMRFQDVPFDIMSEYAEIDAQLHLAVGQHLVKEIDAPNAKGAPSLRPVFDNEVALTKVCFEMEWAGIKINRAYVEGALENENGLLQNAKQEFRRLTGREFIDSGKVLCDVFTKMGEKFPTTEKGNPSFTDAVLEGMDSELAKTIQQIRHHEKRAGTYFSSFLFFADHDDCIHPNIRIAGTETGRFSFSDPNLQNVSAEEGEVDAPYVIRGSFKPRDEFCFVEIDYAQQEFRLFLDYAGEKSLIREVMGGMDVHDATAKMLGIPRRAAKTIAFGLLYSMGTEKLSRALGITESEARRYKDLYFSRLPRVEDLIARVSGRGKTRGFIWNCYGRRCYIDNREWCYVLPNHLIQSSGADTIKFAMVLIHGFLRGKKSRMLLNIHDSLLFEIHSTELDIVPHLKELMEGVYQPRNGMRLTVDSAYSWESWAKRDMQKGMPEDVQA